MGGLSLFHGRIIAGSWADYRGFMGGLSLLHGRIIAPSRADVFGGRAGLRAGCKTRVAGETAGGAQKSTQNISKLFF